MERFIVITGHPETGFKYTGPFLNIDAASQYTKYLDEPHYIVPLDPAPVPITIAPIKLVKAEV